MPGYPARAALLMLRGDSRAARLSTVAWSTVISLTIAVAVMIVVLAVINGFERALQQQVLRYLPHALVRFDAPPADWRDLVRAAEAREDVIAAAPFVQGNVLLVVGDRLESAALWGVDPDAEARQTGIDERIESGRWDALSAARFTAVIGSRLARRLGLVVGDTAMVVLPELRMTLVGAVPRQRRVRIGGVVSTGTELDDRLIYLPLGDAAALFRHREGYAGIKLATADLFEARTTLQALLWTWFDHSPRGYDWRNTHGNLHQAIQLQKVIMTILLGLVLLVAGFNLVSAMILHVRARRAQFAIQRTYGASRRSLLAGVLLAALAMGGLGAFGGVVLGAAIALLLEPGFALVSGSAGAELMAEYFVRSLPSDPHWQDMLLTALLAVGVSVCAACYPAWRAANLLPARVLRHE